MKKIFFALIGCLTVVCAHAAQIANIEYVHKMIEHKWDITVPYNPTLSNVKSMANMKYLLTAIDVANEILNGEPTTNYGNGEFATTQVADTTATNTAVETLIKKEIEYEFFLTTTSDTNSFSFSISAAGEFVVDWGDGKTETITKPDTTKTTYSHTYNTSKSYTIKLAGQATAYNTSVTTAAISFSSSASKIASIDGSLGVIFGTLSSDTNNQPRFYQTFYNATNMTGSIPSDLFAGISGAPAKFMFYDTFSGCSGLTGAIPDGLFVGISGAPAFAMFDSTFSGCSGLTGAIPDGLFGNLTGAPAIGMFSGTFSGCSGLTSIPDGLFAGISGAPAKDMFSGTFEGCSGLTGAIPENLFGNISGTAQDGMFRETFSHCTSLTGPSAKINGKYIYEIWPETDQYGNGFMYANCKKLSDYMYIPTVYGGMGGTNIEYVSAPDNVDYKFFVTTIPDVELFMISIAAAGEFYIDWGDGAKQKITKNDTEKYNIGHKYLNSGKYTIGIGGQATAYNTVTNSLYEKESTVIINYRIVAIEGYISDSDYSLDFIESIDGSLGAIFGTLADGSQPSFEGTFSEATNMIGSIPTNLFEGISGTIRDYMFYGTFKNCTSLTGPSARINGQYLYEIWPSATTSQVSDMYYGASKLSDYASIPSDWK